MTDAKYSLQDEKAHSTILLSLSDDVLYEVTDEETTAGVWKKLEKLYMTKSLTNKLLLKQRLFSLRIKEGMTLKDHLDALNSILMDLKNVGVKIDNEDAALILLVSLPPSFVNFVNSFVVGKDTITLKDVRSNLHSRELRHQVSRTSESQPVGLSAMGHDRGRHRTKKGKGKVVAKDDSGLELDVVLLVVDYKGTPLVWITDSAYPFHMSPNRDWFVAYEEFDDGHVFMGNNSPCFKYTSKNSVLRVSKAALVVMKATQVTSSLYTLQGETITCSASVSCSKKSHLDFTMLWHMRLGHMSEKGMFLLSKRELLDNHKVASLEFCEHCVIRKQKQVSFSKAVHQTKATLDYLRADCWGPSRVHCLGGARYILSIIDNFSRMTWVFMMKHKSETFEKFKHWKILIKNQTGRKIKRLRTANGLDFCSREFNDFCRDKEIARHYMVRYTPQQNRVVEQINRTLLERTRCLLSPGIVIDCKTPIEVWSGKPADYLKLYVFGCLAYYHVSEGKLDPRGKKGIFIGYDDGVKGYQIWSPSERRVILSRDVTFDDDYLFRVKQDPVESNLKDGVSEKVEDVPK
ncbi:retrovirus-related pol polyprotein from transposon TNT 1-94 [Tanacetum coccineum]|uniref:Retrovirus-related pol polyprotein from transposon TNT 1-94 n=1 Tax=Tanacetum coccineum TaxID=301880 RepID=A0ABQ5FX09_9ASTR